MARDRVPAPSFLSIRDFDQLQHYRDRALIWIKLHVSLLDDYVFQQLPDSAKFHLIGLMLLAARMGNRLPNNPAYLARQIGADTPIDVESLLKKGFLIPCKRKRTKPRDASNALAPAEQPASLDKNREDKNREEEEGDENAPPLFVLLSDDDLDFQKMAALCYGADTVEKRFGLTDEQRQEISRHLTVMRSSGCDLARFEDFENWWRHDYRSNWKATSEMYWPHFAPPTPRAVRENWHIALRQADEEAENLDATCFG